MKIPFIILILSLNLINLTASPITVIPNSELDKSEIQMVVDVLEVPYTISIQYDDTELTKTSESDFILLRSNYKLTEASETQPFYINLSSGISNENHEFIIEISLGEFIGKDYRDNKVYTSIYPSIQSYRDYHYSFKIDKIENKATMNYYQPEGAFDQKHIGAFTFYWEANEGLAAGTYTSTNIISITSENALAPQVF